MFKATPVVGHQPWLRGDLAGHHAQHCRLVRIVGEQVLARHEMPAHQRSQAGEKDHRAGTGRQAGRLGIEIARRREA